MSDADILALASEAVDKARQLGADQADVIVFSSTESSVQVRRGQVERVIDAGSHAAGIRVIKGKRTAICSTADLTPRALDQMVRDTVDLAAISEPDEFAGLPDPEDLSNGLGGGAADLQIYDERIEALTTDEMKEMALRCEGAAFDYDAKVSNSDGATVEVTRGLVALANSQGFRGSYPSTTAAIAVEVMCNDADNKKRNDSWYSMERALHRLESPEAIGRKAAARAVAKLGATKISTTQVPVVWEAPVALALLRIISQAVSGEALYRRATFLADFEGEAIASDMFTLTDEPLLPGRVGSRPFDGEGVRSRALPIFERGVFRNFLFDTYHARRLGRRTTGAAHRGIDSAPAPGPSNLILSSGSDSPESLYEGLEEGFFVTDLMGFGVNMTTGDFSRGAQGFWIEKGRLTFPVTEVNVSGNLRDMLAGIDGLGDDLLWRGGFAAPSLRMARLTISGL